MKIKHLERFEIYNDIYKINISLFDNDTYNNYDASLYIKKEELDFYLNAINLIYTTDVNILKTKFNNILKDNNLINIKDLFSDMFSDITVSDYNLQYVDINYVVYNCSVELDNNYKDINFNQNKSNKIMLIDTIIEKMYLDLIIKKDVEANKIAKEVKKI